GLNDELGVLYTNRGAALRGLGRYAEAAELARGAVDFFQKLLAANPSLPDYRYLKALALRDEARAQQPAAPAPSGRALKLLEQAGALLDELDRQFGGLPVYRQALARTDVERARLLEQFGRTTEAEAAYKSAADRLDQLAQAYPKEPDIRRDRAFALNESGGAALRQNRLAEAADR